MKPTWWGHYLLQQKVIVNNATTSRHNQPPHQQLLKKNSRTLVLLFGGLLISILFISGWTLWIFHSTLDDDRRRIVGNGSPLEDDYCHHGFEILRASSSLLSNGTTLHRGRRRRRHSRSHVLPDDDIHDDDNCNIEYRRVTQNHTKGLTIEDFERSRAHLGNRHLLAQFGDKLLQSSFSSSSTNNTVLVVVCGGSITLGHGVTPVSLRYSDQLQVWLNEMYGSNKNGHQNHNYDNHHLPRQEPPVVVLNKGSHGADMCAMAKRMNFLNLPTTPDLFLLEFAVNDYQGQDHKIFLDHKTNVFFDGFQSLALCAEVVVHKIRTNFPQAAIVFLEFQTAILNRKTAQLLHMGVAQHYDIPVISYADALFPDFYRLIDRLESTGYAIPQNASDKAILPYPHGCAECQAEHIIPQFRDKGCKSICTFVKRSGYYNTKDECDKDHMMIPCYVPFLAHDAVHPSAVGHAIAKDLLTNFIAQINRWTCQGRIFPKPSLPTYSGWMVAGKSYHDELSARSDFVLVQDTMEIFAKKDPLRASGHSNGFALRGDQYADRIGWIADKEGEWITFDIKLPKAECYVVYLSVLKSYETVGSITVLVKDIDRNTQTAPKTFDLVWEPRISIPADLQLTSEQTSECTGSCQVRVTTNAEIPNRGGNRVKIMSLAVRHCLLGKNAMTMMMTTSKKTT